jgi:nucleoside 2-deoxyribosyltransferase
MIKMKKILLISAHTKRSEQIFDAIESASKINGAAFLSLNNLISDGLIFSTSITQNILHLIESSDLVVAYIVDYNPNLFYEIGFAHALGKTVVIITDKSFKVPADLVNQKIIILSNDPVDKNQNIFRLEKLFHQILYEKEISGFQKPTDEMKDLEVSNSKIKYEFKDVLHLEGITRYKMLEKWFLELVQGIPAWEVIQAPPVDKGYDFIIWNGSKDNEFNILGNPIPVELKAGNRVI